MKIIENPRELAENIDDLVAIADQYKNEIGFWPRSILQDAISRGRLIAASVSSGDEEFLVGFLVFGGVFPNGRIQAVAVDPKHVRCGVAQTLVTAIVANLEREGYLAISAKPAKDLLIAQAFYQNNGFNIVRTQQGGQARKREIIVREKLLESPSLFGALAPPTRTIHIPSSVRASELWVIDINVFFDLVKAGRKQYEMAAAIFAAALDGRARVAVTSEFSNELGRNAHEGKPDPLLQVAKALPKLRINARERLQSLANEIHRRVFVAEKPSQADTPQAHSDCSHIAECILANASAFVTSDGVLLRSRRYVRERWGVDVVALEDFADALSSTILRDDFQPARGADFYLSKIGSNDAKLFSAKIGSLDINELYFRDDATRPSSLRTAAHDDDDEVFGLIISVAPETLGQPHQMLLLVDNHRQTAELVADCLLHQAIDSVGRSGLNLIELADVPGQIVTRKVALQAGFVANQSQATLSKAALGIPITPSSFPRITDQLRLSFGSRFSDLLPDGFDLFDELLCSDPEQFKALEKMFSPTLIASNDRRVSIQPIGASYAAELLGTSDQTSLLEKFEGAFRSQKIYVSSGRSKKSFQENQIIMFYESSRTGGRGAIVAAARVDNVVTQKKREAGSVTMKKTVLDSVERFSATEEVTLTGFSSLLRFPRPVYLTELEQLQATGRQNLQTTTVIATEAAQKIFDLGWSDGR